MVRFDRKTNQHKFDIRLSQIEFAPHLCLVVILTVAILLRTSFILWGAGVRCAGADQFWFVPYNSNWPLGGVFFLILFLLFAWNSCLAFSVDWHEKGNRFVVILNGLAILALMSVSLWAHNTATISYQLRTNTYEGWQVAKPLFGYRRIDQCITALPYVGRWTVLSKSIPPRGNPFPMQWIEFRDSLTFIAADNNWKGEYEGRWDPPYRTLQGDTSSEGESEMWWDDGDAFWIFDLTGNRLVLTTPEWVYWAERSTVVLRRESE